MSDPLLSVQNLEVFFKRTPPWFWQRSRMVKAVNGVTFDIPPGEILGVVGESGCGKSTLARALVGLNPVHGGSISWEGRDLSRLTKREWHEVRKSIQMIFQDPLASLDPRMTIGEIIAEPLRSFFPKMSSKERRRRVDAMMERVSLRRNVINRYPHEFSGGQCQRIGIARALIVEPRLVVCDEPVSALDVSIQAQIINLLQDLQKDLGLTLIFISHDVGVVEHISDRIMVMYLGRVMELVKGALEHEGMHHPYTQALLSSIPVADPRYVREHAPIILEGDLPSPSSPPPGCVFCTRCPEVVDQCHQSIPPFKQHGATTLACFMR